MNANNNASVSFCSTENINPVNSYNLPHNFNNHLVNNVNLLIICFLLISYYIKCNMNEISFTQNLWAIRYYAKHF